MPGSAGRAEQSNTLSVAAASDGRGNPKAGVGQQVRLEHGNDVEQAGLPHNPEGVF
jgi:hypothetical protein